MLVVTLLAMVATTAADYGDPRKGSCATGDMPAKFPFGGCMCMPKCTAGKCPAAPGGATAIPTCEFSSTGKPPPDYCGLRCKNGETCPTGTTCEMPTGICAFPYPMGEPEEDDLEAMALDEQLIATRLVVDIEPELEVAGPTIPLTTFDGTKATTQPWRATNDPVMGGKSVSTFKIDSAAGIARWVGEVKIVPKLHAPGFCTATTGGYDQGPDHFPDMSAAECLLVTIRNANPSGLSSFKVGMQTGKNEREGGFESKNFTTPADGSFHTHFIAFSEMRSSFRGQPEGGAPTKAQLGAISGLSFNQDGVAGKFELDVKSISAGSKGGCGGGGGKTLDLVTFVEGAKNNYRWTDLNDPVMGGRSTSTFKVEGGKGIFDGVCRIVPSLKAPGFCNAETKPGLTEKIADASAFIEGGIEIEVTSTGNLTEFKTAFGTRSQHDFGSFKADFTVTPGANTVRVPFSSFSNKWSSSTGEPTVKCSAENKHVCPTAHSLATIGAIGVWAEGYAGQFHLELTAIRAYVGGSPPGPAPGPPAPGPPPGVNLWTVRSNTPWHLTNDPVMGGQSHSTIKVDTANQVAVFEGECKIVPKLKAPGFCDAETTASAGKPFPSAAEYDGIEVTLKQSVAGGLLDFKQSWGGRGSGRESGSYKAPLKLKDTTDYQKVYIPFTEYTNKWSDFTGGCTDHGAICCSADHPEVCPTAAAKAKIESIGIWAEGTAGKFNLDIRSIRAVKAPSGGAGACAATEFCCPDAKHCLTPVPDKTCSTSTPCATGETCCPLTKICVEVGAACKSPCADQGSYCCPDAKHCLTPVNPGHLCDPSDKTACKTGDVCCPLIKECVSVGAACTPSDDKPDWIV